MHNSDKVQFNRLNRSPLRREDHLYSQFFQEDGDSLFLYFLYVTHKKSCQLKHKPGLELQMEDLFHGISVSLTLTYLTMDELLKKRKQLRNKGDLDDIQSILYSRIRNSKGLHPKVAKDLEQLINYCFKNFLSIYRLCKDGILKSLSKRIDQKKLQLDTSDVYIITREFLEKRLNNAFRKYKLRGNRKDFIRYLRKVIKNFVVSQIEKRHDVLDLGIEHRSQRTIRRYKKDFDDNKFEGLFTAEERKEIIRRKKDIIGLKIRDIMHHKNNRMRHHIDNYLTGNQIVNRLKLTKFGKNKSVSSIKKKLRMLRDSKIIEFENIQNQIVYPEEKFHVIEKKIKRV